jgi:hypothetical protein
MDCEESRAPIKAPTVRTPPTLRFSDGEIDRLVEVTKEFRGSHGRVVCADSESAALSWPIYNLRGFTPWCCALWVRKAPDIPGRAPSAVHGGRESEAQAVPDALLHRETAVRSRDGIDAARTLANAWSIQRWVLWSQFIALFAGGRVRCLVSGRSHEFYPKIHKHIVEWILVALLLRGAYDVMKIMVLGRPWGATAVTVFQNPITMLFLGILIGLALGLFVRVPYLLDSLANQPSANPPSAPPPEIPMVQIDRDVRAIELPDVDLSPRAIDPSGTFGRPRGIRLRD